MADSPPYADADADANESLSAELDGDGSDPIAICGFAIKFPQDALNADLLWDMLMERRCAMTEPPANRFRAAGFYSKEVAKQTSTNSVKGGHFIAEDPSVFDAGFFNISPAEASAMDPMQRWLLETTYRAFENAGMPFEDVSGTSTGVYAGSFTHDYLIQLFSDPEFMPAYLATGVGSSMLANRISWFFNLHGPSVTMDSACSSAATSLDIACQSLKSGSCEMALVAGSNLTFSPAFIQSLSTMNFLSPDGRCYSFDHRANGYARGEGIAVVILKKLSDAIRDCNTIRSVIRATGSNEDGRTPAITQPSHEAQLRLIRETYRKAHLSMAHTRYFEAHGTGTPIGDPIEALAIGQAFREFRSSTDRIYVGAIKSNIGHLEGASALAGLIKAVLVLERGIIPPNANFEKLNTNIDDEDLRLKFPNQSYSWPSRGLRRASVNSFGYGGSNSHIVLDDAYNYMRLRGLVGKHCTRILPHQFELSTTLPLNNTTRIPQANQLTMTHNGRTISRDISEAALSIEDTSWTHELVNKISIPQSSRNATPSLPKLLVWSTSDIGSMDRMIAGYEAYLLRKPIKSRDKDNTAEDLAYSLDTCRSHLSCRSFAIVQPPLSPGSLKSDVSTTVRIRSDKQKIAYIFTGQGSQWSAMGRELGIYPVYQKTLEQADSFLKTLGCPWSVLDELSKPQTASRVDDPEFSQTLTTVLQVALVNLLKSFGVKPYAVVGHSSGEIAAAYAAGYINAISAWKLAYFRGVCSAAISSQASQGGTEVRGAMIAVGLSAAETEHYLCAVNAAKQQYGISLACMNSPSNVTVAGEDLLVDRLQTLLEQDGIFSRKLRVSLAYHSQQMIECASKYESMVGQLAPSHTTDSQQSIQMISSVSGQTIAPKKLLMGSYWAQNMVAPVQFSKAISAMLNPSSQDSETRPSDPAVGQLIEIGPHPALKSPLREILINDSGGHHVTYVSLLNRGMSAHETLLQAMGTLHCNGLLVNLRAINDPTSGSKSLRRLLVDLPEYPFDHSRGYWYESRVSKSYRFREQPPSTFLGTRRSDENLFNPRWRLIFRRNEKSWIQDHMVNGAVVYPAAGMLMLAVEAVKSYMQETSTVQGFFLHDVEFMRTIVLDDETEGTEIETSLRLTENETQHGLHSCDFAISSCALSDTRWVLNCRGLITVENIEEDAWSRMRNHGLGASAVSSSDMYAFLNSNGLEYGPQFQRAYDQSYSMDREQAAASISLFPMLGDDCEIHPASLDTIFHLGFTALTKGGTHSMSTMMPTRLDSLWISNILGPNHVHPALQTFVKLDRRGTRTCESSGIALNKSDGKVLIWYERLRMASVTSHPTSLLNDQSSSLFCMRLECKPDIGKLQPNEICSLLESLHPSSSEDHEFWDEINLLADLSLEDLVNTTSTELFKADDATGPEFWKYQYLNWASHYLAEGDERCGRNGPAICAYKSLDRLRDHTMMHSGSTGRLMAAVSHNLTAFFSNEARPLEILMQSGILRDYYAEMNLHSSTMQIAIYLSLLAHQKPRMNILEVGGGTGGCMRNFLRSLATPTGSGESVSLRCNRYDFTDVSPTLVAAAKNEFAQSYPQMTFATLDIERDYIEQGLGEREHDVVLAAQVLHITRNLKETLQRLRKSLKDGGKLILQESLDPSGGLQGFVFGVFPGWWLGVEDGRIFSPNLSVDRWNDLLRQCGFSGVDFVRSFGEDINLHVGWIVTTAIETGEICAMQDTGTLLLSGHTARVFIYEDSTEQAILLDALTKNLSDQLGMSIQVEAIPRGKRTTLTHTTAPHSSAGNLITIMLTDFGASSLTSLDDSGWQWLKTCFQTSGRLLWISDGGGRQSKPEHGLLDGLARTIRHELPEQHLVTLALDHGDAVSTSVRMVAKVVEEMAWRDRDSPYEQEYVTLDGQLHTRRLIEAEDLRSDIEADLALYKTTTVPCDGSVRFNISCQSLGFGHNFQYVQVASPTEGLSNDDVEIIAKSIVLKSPTEFGRNRDGASMYMCYVSGVVKAVGNGTDFQPGDRVFSTCSRATPASHITVSSHTVTKISDDFSFPDACIVMPPYSTASHLLDDLGCVRPNQTVLVHPGDSAVGHAIFRFLTKHGIHDIWMTATTEKDQEIMFQDLGVSSDHVMPATLLEGSSILIPQWREKFDLLLFSQAPKTKSFLAAVKHDGHVILPYVNGQVTKDLALIGAFPCPPSVSITVFDPRHIVPSVEALRHAAQVSSEFGILNPRNYTLFSGSAINEALDYLSKAPDNESIVIDLESPMRLSIQVPKNLSTPGASSTIGRLSPEHTYLIAGGLGGLGRSIARWLVKHGAQNLVLLSRSLPSKDPALRLLNELKESGVRVEVFSCDISDDTALRKTVASCIEHFPPIKGCIQASMVLKEVFFQNLSLCEWESALAPKVRGSWNLHNILPKGLEFFCMLSSIMGVIGTKKLAGYNAGNTYQAALAKHRLAQGEHAVCLDLGGIVDEGYVAESGLKETIFQRNKLLLPVTMEQVYVLLEKYCLSSDTIRGQESDPEIIIGLNPPAYWKQNVDRLPAIVQQPLWGHMHHLKWCGLARNPTNNHQAVVEKNPKRKRALEMMHNLPTGRDEYQEGILSTIAIAAIAEQVSEVLGISEERLNCEEPLTNSGIDSLSAIELRDWIYDLFGIKIQVFEILGGATIQSIARYIQKTLTTTRKT